MNKEQNINNINLIKSLYRCDVKLFDSCIDNVVNLSQNELGIIKQNILQCAYMDVYDLDKWAYFVEKLAVKNIYVDFSEILTRYIQYSSTLDYKLFKALFENTIVNNDFISSFFAMPILFRFDDPGNWVDGINYEIKDVYTRLYSQEIYLSVIENALKNNAYSRNATYHQYLNDVIGFYYVQDEKKAIVDEIKSVNITIKKTRKI